MTREQAKREIDSLDFYLQNHTDDYGEESHTAMMMAIKALEQQTCEDCISREAVLENIKGLKKSPWFNDDIPGVRIVRKEAVEIIEDLCIKNLPSVNPAKKQELCEDAVSRAAVLDIFADNADAVRPYSKTWEEVKALPSVNPQPKMGWIPVNEKLPEDIKPVIVTWKNTDPKSYYQYIVGKHYIGTAHYKNGKWFWYSSVTEDLLAEYGRCDCEEFDEAIDVIAWMPLPAPYKAESDPKERSE